VCHLPIEVKVETEVVKGAPVKEGAHRHGTLVRAEESNAALLQGRGDLEHYSDVNLNDPLIESVAVVKVIVEQGALPDKDL
jgi:hypothetical protein